MNTLETRTTPSKRAYSYIRFSSAQQHSGDSIRRQLAATKAYCERNNLILDETPMQDLGISAFRGTNSDKGALGDFLRACESGLIPKGSALIVESLDRITRQSPRKAVALLSTILEAGIEVHFTMDNKVLLPDAKDEGLDLIISVAWAMRAHDESVTKSVRTKAAYAERLKEVQNGAQIVLHNTLPWWLILDENKKIICPPDREAALRRIFELAANGYSYHQIAKSLNDELIPCWKQHAKSPPPLNAWNARKILLTIRSDSVTGLFQEINRTRRSGRSYQVPNYYPALISPEIVAQARGIRLKTAPSAAGRKPKGQSPINLLRGLIKHKGFYVRFVGYNRTLKNPVPLPTVLKTGNTHPDTPEELNYVKYYGAYDCYDSPDPTSHFYYSAEALEMTLILAMSELTPIDIQPTLTIHPPRESLQMKRQIDEISATLQNLLKVIETGSTTVMARIVELEGERTAKQKQLEDAKSKEAVEIVPNEVLTSLQSVKTNYWNEPEKRVHLSAQLQKLINKVHVAKNLRDLPIPEKVRGAIIRELISNKRPPVDTSSFSDKSKHPLAMLVRFSGGAYRLIIKDLPLDPMHQTPESIIGAKPMTLKGTYSFRVDL